MEKAFNLNLKNKELEKTINNISSLNKITDKKVEYWAFFPDENYFYTIKHKHNFKTIHDDFYTKSLYNNDDLILFNYSEGDVTFVIYLEERDYILAKSELIAWYKERYEEGDEEE